ncbi:unnamed protein product [Calicophoron daubneyi]|uniref:RRM domain-containing protein n=1 Tax=Calicophoron daubneyi TaxID=300641 RepID=A0AAV2TWK7_CALDB
MGKPRAQSKATPNELHRIKNKNIDPPKKTKNDNGIGAIQSRRPKKKTQISNSSPNADETPVTGEAKSSLLPVGKHSARKKTGSRKFKKPRLSGRQSLKAELHKAKNLSSLLLRNLPTSVNYVMMKNVVPNATKIKLFKKGAKRHAFVSFSDPESRTEAAKNLQSVKLEGQKIRVTTVDSDAKTSKVDKSAQEQFTPDCTTLTISNLPFVIDKPQLEEEFPTASNIVMNVNSAGRFRGSCLLEFESADDCRVVFDACRHRQIGGRRIVCRVGSHFQTADQLKERRPEFWGIKVTGIPLKITEKKMRGLFTSDDLLSLRSNEDAQGGTRTAVFCFNNKNAQKNALKRFNDKLLGENSRARPWKPARRRSKKKKKNSVQKQEPPSNPTDATVEAMNDHMENKKKKKKHHRSSENPDDAVLNGYEMSSDTHLDGHVGKKKRKHLLVADKVDDTDSRGSDIAPVSEVVEAMNDHIENKKKKKKKHHRSSENPNDAVLNGYEMSSDTHLEPPKKKKKHKKMEVD